MAQKSDSTQPFRKLLTWLAKEVGRKLLDPVITWVLGGAVVLLPTILLWFRGGINFLTSDFPVAGWMISAAAGFAFFLSFLLLRQRVQIIRLRPPPQQTFVWRRLEWILTPDFWSNYQHLLVEQLSDGFLKTAVQGPFCPSCKRAIAMVSDWTDINDVCPGCKWKFDFKDVPPQLLVSRYPLETLRRLAYVEAQAAARRNEI